MDVSDSVVRFEEGLEDGFFAGLKHFEPLSILDTFEELCAQEYVILKLPFTLNMKVSIIGCDRRL